MLAEDSGGYGEVGIGDLPQFCRAIKRCFRQHPSGEWERKNISVIVEADFLLDNCCPFKRVWNVVSIV